jgi:hypothetical protein
MRLALTLKFFDKNLDQKTLILGLNEHAVTQFRPFATTIAIALLGGRIHHSVSGTEDST